MRGKYSWMGAVIGAVAGLILASPLAQVQEPQMIWKIVLTENFVTIGAIIGLCVGIIVYPILEGDFGEDYFSSLFSGIGALPWFLTYLFYSYYLFHYYLHKSGWEGFTALNIFAEVMMGLAIYATICLFSAMWVYAATEHEEKWTGLRKKSMVGCYMISGGLSAWVHLAFPWAHLPAIYKYHQSLLTTLHLPPLLLTALFFAILGYYTGELVGSSIEGWIKRRRERRQRISYYKSKIKTWKEEGYSVELEKLKDLDLAERKIREYESRIQRLKKIERELNSLNTKGFEKEVQSIRSKLKDPEKAEQAEKEFLELKRKIEEFERMKEEIIAMIDEAVSG